MRNPTLDKDFCDCRNSEKCSILHTVHFSTEWASFCCLWLRIEEHCSGEMKYSREPIYHLTSSFTLVFPRREAVDNDTPSNNAAWVRSEYSRGRSKGGQMLQEMMHMLSCLKLNLRRQCSTAAFPRNLGLAFRSRSWGKKAGKRRSRFFPPSSFVSFRDKSFTSHILSLH